MTNFIGWVQGRWPCPPEALVIADRSSSAGSGIIVAGRYGRAEFERLVTQGIPIGNRELKPLMRSVAKSRYSQLTTHERDALYAYLKKRSEHSNA